MLCLMVLHVSVCAHHVRYFPLFSICSTHLHSFSTGQPGHFTNYVRGSCVGTLKIIFLLGHVCSTREVQMLHHQMPGQQKVLRCAHTQALTERQVSLQGLSLFTCQLHQMVGQREGFHWVFSLFKASHQGILNNSLNLCISDRRFIK